MERFGYKLHEVYEEDAELLQLLKLEELGRVEEDYGE